MSNAHNHNPNLDNRNSRNAKAYETTVDESSLPDHYLSENSLEKKKRNNDRYMCFLIENLQINMQITWLIEQALLKYEDDEKFYKNLQQIDQAALFFKNLEAMYLENTKYVMRLSAEQHNKLQLFQEKIESIFHFINDRIAVINETLLKTRHEISDMKNQLLKIREDYLQSVTNCFNSSDNYLHFKKFTVGQFQLNDNELKQVGANQWKGFVEIDEQAFRKLGDFIVQALRSSHISFSDNNNAIIRREAEKFLITEFQKNTACLPTEIQISCMKRITQSSEFQHAAEFLTSQIHDHMKRQDAFSDLQAKANDYDAIRNTIDEKEKMVALLEQENEMLGKCKEVLEAASEINLSILEKSTGDHAVFDQLTQSGEFLLDDILAKCKISMQDVKNFEEKKSEEENLSDHLSPH